jgi:DinB superfamily
MFTRDEIIEGIAQVKLDGAAFWGAFDTPAFFAPLGDAWSPADNVRHLAKSTRAVAKALAMPKLALWLMFGRTRRPSATYDEIRDRYAAIPEKKAGAYSPSSRAESDLETWRKTILWQLDEADRTLATAAAKWSDPRLDRYQLPHPLLGKLTVREMLFFTIHHHRHHMEGVERRSR